MSFSLTIEISTIPFEFVEELKYVFSVKTLTLNMGFPVSLSSTFNS
jgi:hypothetical protein